MTADRDPVTQEEAAADFAYLERFEHLLLAVSGGPDSLALMLLMSAWQRARTHALPTLSVATVDHGLRAESASEAQFVASIAGSLGLPHATLKWDDDKPASGLAEAARLARYRLLEAHARSLSPTGVAVVTAHHRDDQAETFLMRLQRGSGIEGLAGMRPLRPLHPGSGVQLARPLLRYAKSRLTATVAAHGVTPVIDPSNEDTTYERVRLRALLARLEDAGIASRAIATAAGRLGSAREALNYAQTVFEETLSLSYGHEVFAAVDRKVFDAGPTYLRQQLLARLIDRFGGAAAMPRLSQIEQLDAAIAGKGKVAATYGGATVSAGEKHIRVWREAGRLRETFALSPGETRAFDARFIVHCAADAPRGLEVRALGRAGMARIATLMQTRGNPPSRAAMAQPAFWRDDELMAVPTLAPFAKDGFARWAEPIYQVLPLIRA